VLLAEELEIDAKSTFNLLDSYFSENINRISYLTSLE
jgi:hypothetical protein